MAIKLWMAVAVAVGIFILQEELFERSEELRKKSSFYHVTNRQISLFLWSFPEYMRRNAREKSGYLPAFRYIDGVTVEPEFADRFVQAPPELLRRYHEWRERGWDVAWNRERGEGELKRFLREDPQWAGREESKELQLAFVGWKNFVLEGEEIEKLERSEEEWEAFFEEYPQYRVGEKLPFVKVAFYNYLMQKSSEATPKPRS